MAISFVGSGVGTHASTSAQTYNFSSLLNSAGSTPTLQSGDLVIVAVNCASTVDRTQATLTPLGYSTAHTDLFANDSNDTNLQVSYKFMTGTPDTSVSIPASNATTAGVAWTVHVFRGVDTTAAIVVTPTTATGINTAQPDPPSITPTTAGSFIYIVGAGAMAAGAAYQSTAPTGLDTSTNAWRQTVLTTTTNDPGIAAGFKSDWSAGAFDCPAFTGGTTTNTGSWAAVAIVLEPYNPIQNVAAALNGAATMAPNGTLIANARCGFEAPTTALPTTTGVDKHSFLTVGNITATMNNSPNGSYCLRVDTGKTGKRRFEIRVNGNNSTAATPNGTVSLGVSDNVADLSAGSFQAGSSTLAGWSIRLKVGEANPTRFRNGGSAVTNLSVATAVGDRYAIEFDTTANTVAFYHCPVSTGVWSAALSNDTLTSNIPSGNWYAVVGGYLTGDSFSIHTTRNGMTADPSSGFVPYDDTVYNSYLAADANVYVPIASALAGSGVIAADATIITPAVIWSAAAALNGTATMSPYAKIVAVSPVAVDVVLMVGESNTAGARNTVTKLPTGWNTTDSNAFIWDDADLLGTGQAIRVLKAPNYSTVTMTIASPGVVSWTAHGLANGDPVVFTTTGALPTGITAGTRYYVVNAATNTFEVASTRGGTSIVTTGSQSGTHTAVANAGHEQQPGGAAYLDTAYMSTIGPSYEFIKHYRADNPSSKLYFFISQQGGGRFSDAAGRGRAANYTYNLSNGAYNEMKVSWNSFITALTDDGKTANIKVCRINLGANSSFDATESSNFQTDLTNLISQMRTDMIGSTTKVVLDRYGALQSDVNQTNYATIKTGKHNIALADPTKVEILSLDGMPTVSTLGGPDSIHLTAPAHVAVGEALYYHSANLWYPQKEQSYNGGNPVSFEWRPGDLRNVFDGSNNLQTVFDVSNNGLSPTQGTSTKRPPISTTAVANGYIARYATGDGTDDILIKSGNSTLMNGSYGLFMAVQMAAGANKCVVGEGGATINPLTMFRSNASGDLEFQHRNDAGTLTTVSLVSGAFNNTMNFVAAWDNTSQVTGRVNGTTGTAQNYTRGTTTMDKMSLFGLAYNGLSEAQISNAKVGIVWATDAVPDSTYLTNAQAYVARRWGAPTPSTVLSANAALTSSGVLAGAITNIVSVASALPTSGVISATIVDIIPVNAALTASGVIGANADKLVPVASAMTASGVLAADANIAITYSADASLNGTATLAADARVFVPVSASLQTSGVLAGDIFTIVPIASAMNASGILAGAITNLIPASASLTSAATLGANADNFVPVASALNGTATLVADATIKVIISASAALTGAATLTGNIFNIIPESMALNGAATLTADIKAIIPIQVSLTTAATLAADGSLNGLISGNAALTASATLVANAGVVVPASVGMTSAGTMGATAFTLVASGAVLNGAATLTSAVSVLVPIQASLASQALLNSDITNIVPVTSTLQSNGTLDSSIFTIVSIGGTMTAQGICNANIFVVPLKRPTRNTFWF